jgi:lipoprotein NlpD
MSYGAGIKYMSMKKIRIVLVVLSVVLITACSTTSQKAPVAERTSATKSASPVKIVVKERPGYYTVRKGDTLNQIAHRFRQDPGSVAGWNSLANKNDIKIGQVLRIQPPDPSSGVQTAIVSNASGVEVKPLPSSSSAHPHENAVVATPKPEAVPASADTSAQAKQEEGIAWMWPAEGKIVASFQEGKSKGIDIAGTLGQKVLAAADGRVIFASAIRGYGNLVIVKHTDSLVSAYAHNKTILVKEGATVSKGQQIAEMGKSDTDKVKLHLEIRRQGKPVDPAKYLPSR